MSCEFRTLVPDRVPESRLRRLVVRALTKLRYNPETTNVSLAFVGDRRMRSLNRRFRKQDRTTDVLSFSGLGRELGEIVISVPQAKRQSAAFGATVIEELDLLVVHGLLHLAGYGHQKPVDRARMRKMESTILGGRSFLRRQLP